MAGNQVNYAFPVWATQGGGLVREAGQSGVCHFVEAPEPGMNLSVGDTMPSEWSIVPANNAARVAMEEMFAD